MDNITSIARKSMYPAQVHIVHSLIRMIRGKLVFFEWMTAKDLVLANGTIFERMTESIKQYYNLDCSEECLHDGVKLFLANMDKAPEKHPEYKVEPPEGEDTFWQDYERIVRMGS